MTVSTATSPGTQAQEAPSTEADLNALLGGTGGSPAATEVETEEPAAETETESTETGGEEESAEEAGEGEGADEAAETEGAEEEAEEGESELSIEESDRDYSDAAYKKAADHYARTKKIQLDPNDPAHRALLKEIMDRGRDFAALKTERENAEAKGDDEKPAATEEATAQPTKPKPEEIQAFIKNAGEVAKARIVPEVSMHIATQFTKALWADEAPQLTQEQADGITTALSQAFWMQLEDALPAIYGVMRNGLGNDAVFGRVETMAVREAAFEHLDGLTDKATGKPLYPNLEQMVESGTIQNAIKANSWIKNIVAGNGRDRVANYAAQVEAAYKIARGEQVNPETVKKAVETGKKQATDREKKIAAGRTAPGKTKGEIGKGPSQAQQTINEIVSGGGSRFSSALARDGKSLKH